MNYTLSVAPMMDWTDRHCRYFHRLLSPGALLYTEMVTTGAVIHGDRDHLLGFDPAERPVVLQLGGCEPLLLARSAAIGRDYGYSGINLNIGCPSDRVQAGRFGACLMAEPVLVAECLHAMRAAVDPLPVSIKTRIGIDERDSYSELARFVELNARAGCRYFILHARKAWLNGLSPKQNRDIPPLCYERVYQLKQDFPHLTIVINGGITTPEQVQQHRARVDGVMIGRAAYQNPYLLNELEQQLTPGYTGRSRDEIVAALLPYIERQLSKDVRLIAITRHILGLFQGQPGARKWRRLLSENAHRRGAGIEVVESALAQVRATGRVLAAATL